MRTEESLARRGELIAPNGLYRLVGVDTFEGATADFLLGDFVSLDDAKAVAESQARPMVPVYCYDDRGVMQFTVKRDD